MASHFNFDTDLNNLLRSGSDGSMSLSGAIPRWQRKAMSVTTTSSTTSNNVSSSSSSYNINNISLNQSNTNISIINDDKSPSRCMRRSINKSPGRIGGLKDNTTRQKQDSKCKTPVKQKDLGDRFIPSRSASKLDVAHYKLTQDDDNKFSDADDKRDEPGNNGNDDAVPISTSKREYQIALNDNLNGDSLHSMILQFQSDPPAGPEGFMNNQKVLFSASKMSSLTRKSNRHIPQSPDRILDAPEMLDDFYLNLLDWNCCNQLAVGLGSCVYLWDATSGSIEQLLEVDHLSTGDYVSAVSWIEEGNVLAVGTSCAEVQIWDVSQQKRLRNMTGHTARVGCLSWNNYVLTSGSRSSEIHHHDVRIADHHIATLQGHTQEVCGLKWSPDHKYLASGGNDNILNIWSSCFNTGATSEPRPIHTFSQNQAAVKALAWCPWQSNLLASGAGTADRCIRFWNINTGVLLNTIDTKSQVCAILWSKHYKELVSSHGYALNQLIIWKYPAMTKLAELTGHQARVFHLAMSPDGQTVISGAADETLRLWKCFTVDSQKTKKKVYDKENSVIMRGHIR